MYITKVEGPQGRELRFKIRSTRGKVSHTVSDEIVLREAFSENTYSLHPDHFAHTGIMIDIGANIGAVTLLACGLGAKHIIAYEPEPENYALLVNNVLVNNYEGAVVEMRPQAVWSHSGMIDLVISQASSTSRPDAVALFPEHVVQVPAVTLADVLDPFEDVDVMKVDAEGAEYEMFRDREVNRKIRTLMMEYHQTTAEKFGALVALLSLTHNVQLFGHYDVDGGQILAKRYE